MIQKVRHIVLFDPISELRSTVGGQHSRLLLKPAPVTWDVKRPQLTVVPIAIGQTFMTQWELLWWLLPMRSIGGLFRRHVLGRVPWEVEKT